jgi:hypothetical protein
LPLNISKISACSFNKNRSVGPPIFPKALHLLKSSGFLLLPCYLDVSINIHLLLNQQYLDVPLLPHAPNAPD